MSLTRQWRSGFDELTSRRMNTRSVPVVSSTSDITGGLGPFTGQVIFNTTDNMLYKYDGSAWVGFSAMGGGFIIIGNDSPPKSHEARYFATAIQSIPNATDTKVQFPNVFANVSNDVTPSGAGNTDFTLNRAGLWHIAANMSYATAAGSLERHLFLQTGSAFNAANRFAFSTDGNVGTGVIALAASATIRLTAGTVIICGAFQNSGAAINTDPRDANSVHGAINISLVWLRP